MLLTSIIAQLRTVLDDAQQPYLWTDTELFSYVKTAFSALNTVLGGLTVTMSLELKEGQERYSLPENVFDVSISGWDKLPNTFKDTENVLAERRYYSYYNGILRVFPIPLEDEEITVNAKLTTPSTVTITTDVYLPEFMANAIVYKACSEAYLKGDSETFNPKRVTLFRDLFKQELDSVQKTLVRWGGGTYNRVYHGGLF